MPTAGPAGVHIKKWKIQCVAVVAVRLDLSREKSRRDIQTNLLLNGWNSIAHAAHIMCDVYNHICYVYDPARRDLRRE